MKMFLSLLIFLGFSNAFGVSSIICTSRDFNPTSSTGQQMKLTFEKGRLISALLAKGSWGCNGQDNAPRKVAQNQKAAIFSADFGCRDFAYNARIVVPVMPGAPIWIAFNFAYNTDDAPKQSKNILVCK
jgi:hypothetical protein